MEIDFGLIVSAVKEIQDKYDSISVAFKSPEHPNGSFSVEFETKKVVGVVSIWSTGYIDVLVLELESEEELVNFNCEEKKIESLFQKVNNI
ncbi:immunity protein TriTu family protein [Sulfidibacter corallicola]|uniref:Uncharacterized protein n=1 Tax=Sulfidibacter corallicola TaxID=2818388 RepID=A0A8A4TM36_SULCO|nr:hypothetical protein [Sulfidibacter corallicola]QTD50172.1 hypothetical protein J3U87_31695 [Sulfidibacter corallicola]